MTTNVETYLGEESRLPIRIATIADGSGLEPEFRIALLGNEGEGRWRELASVKHPGWLLSLRRWWRAQ